MSFTRLASKNSIKSTSSSGKGATHSEGRSELNSEIESLKQTIQSLKSSIESRDAAIGKLAREKEKVFVELKSAQRAIRELRQQLSDERSIHAKEKEYLVEEIQRLSRNEESEVRAKQIFLNQSHVVHKEQIQDSLEDELLKKDEIIYKLCAKYMKLKNNKSFLHRQLERLKTEVQETRHKTIGLLEENKNVMDKIIKKMFKSASVSLNSKKYLKLLKQNIKLQNENAQLKLCLSSNIRLDEDCDAKLHEDHDISNPVVVAPPPPPVQNPQQTIIFSGEKIKSSPKPHRRHIKWRSLTSKKRNNWPNSALFYSLYREHRAFSIELQNSFKKSRSMPCLSGKLTFNDIRF